MIERKKKKGNVGEWTEVYVFFKLLADPRLSPCNEHLTTTRRNKLNIEHIYRVPENGCDQICYTYNKKKKEWSFYDSEKKKHIFTAVEWEKHAKKLYDAIQANEKGTFEVKEAYDLLSEKLMCYSIKAKSQEKKDITLCIRDTAAGGSVCNGYSIKSLMGSNPTLFNSSQASCIEYEIIGANEDKLKDHELYISSVEDLRTKKSKKDHPYANLVTEIEELGGSLQLSSLNRTFRKNLQYIDTRMDELLAKVVLKKFSAVEQDSEDDEEEKNNMESLIRETAKSWDMFQKVTRNKIYSENRKEEKTDIEDLYNLYEYKIKKFLEASALGMVAKTLWKGGEDANGGFIIAKPKGDIVTFQIYHRSVFLKYLFLHTKLDTPSISKLNKTKKIEKSVCRIFQRDNGKFYIRFPLMIRYLNAQKKRRK